MGTELGLQVEVVGCLTVCRHPRQWSCCGCSPTTWARPSSSPWPPPGAAGDPRGLAAAAAAAATQETSVVCPCHGSTFSLQDGALLHGPATAPQPAYRTRVRDGKVEVRLAHT